MHNPVAPVTPIAAADNPLWQHNRILLNQAIDVIDRLSADALPDFNYAQAVGPHLRHVIEHYQALLTCLLDSPPRCVDYDSRRRDADIQTDSQVTRRAFEVLLADLDACAVRGALPMHAPLTTRLQSGARGEFAVEVPTTLGRELLFLSSHTVHHFALLGHYCKAAGVDLGPDFGKAPSTLAFERQSAAA